MDSIQVALNDIEDLVGIAVKKAYLYCGTLDTVSIGIDGDAPSLFTGLGTLVTNNDFLISAVDGSAQNKTGRVLDACLGTVSFQPNKLGGGTTIVNFWSERSTDGIVWTQNSNSLRILEVSNSGETFKTTVSSALDWQIDEFIRFRVYAATGGAIEFTSPSDTVLGGEVIQGYSVLWELGER